MSDMICAFCGKAKGDVAVLVASQQPGLGICNSCVVLSADALLSSYSELQEAHTRLLKERLSPTAKAEVKKELLDRVISVLQEEATVTGNDHQTEPTSHDQEVAEAGGGEQREAP